MYLNFFQPTLKAGGSREFTIMMINDEARPIRGQLTLSLETKSGEVLAHGEQPFALDALGSATYRTALAIPGRTGGCVLRAIARPDQKNGEATVCRRWTSIID